MAPLPPFLLTFSLSLSLHTESPPLRKKAWTHDACEELSKHLAKSAALPTECQKYNDVVANLRRRDTDTTHPTQWMS
jgi:hypothetical protein